MKVLFSAMHFAYFRNFESVVRALAERGHQVHLAADESENMGGQSLVERLAAECPTVTWGWTPPLQDEPWFALAQKVRFGLDYVRFLAPRYQDAPKLRLRNVERTARILRWLTIGVAGLRPGRRAVEAGLKWTERSLPRSAAMERWLRDQAPDVVLLASLTFSRSSHVEQLKAARAAGVPVAACVMSWDHLSSKALIHIHPDLALVWNPVQKHEAVDMHRIAGDTVAVTGAQCYDQWFSARPRRSAEEFRRTVGLAIDRPYVLYVCSTMSPALDPPEPFFVKQWVETLRASEDPVLRNTGILVRPHPERIKEWSGVSLDGIDNLVVRGGNPIDGDAKQEYFESLCHSAAVVGICTSAFLEAAIVGRPVLTLLLPQFAIHQEGMAHFRYLRNVEGGVLLAAPSIDAHLRQLSSVLSAPSGRAEANKRFVEAFIRPNGLDRPATPIFVDCVERLAETSARQPQAIGSPLARALTGRLSVMTRSGLGRWLLMDAFDDARAQSEQAGQQIKEQLLQKRADYRDAKRQRRAEVLRATEDERRGKQWRKWRRGLNARKQVARLKGSVKQMIGVRQP